MDKLEKEVLQVSKEIAVKFIEVQRISHSSFSEIFPNVYKVVLDTVLQGHKAFEEQNKKK